MKKFWGFYKNESYSVGCNGGTVYIYDLTGKELAKFNLLVFSGKSYKFQFIEELNERK